MFSYKGFSKALTDELSIGLRPATAMARLLWHRAEMLRGPMGPLQGGVQGPNYIVSFRFAFLLDVILDHKVILRSEVSLEAGEAGRRKEFRAPFHPSHP
jgi:hypothetical protein